MAWKGQAAPRYNRRRKKLPPEIQKALDGVHERILKNPLTGERKRGPLKDVWVEKFKVQNDQHLLVYQVDQKAHTVTFLDIGRHENFYRDLEKYVKKS